MEQAYWHTDAAGEVVASTRSDQGPPYRVMVEAGHVHPATAPIVLDRRGTLIRFNRSAARWVACRLLEAAALAEAHEAHFGPGERTATSAMDIIQEWMQTQAADYLVPGAPVENCVVRLLEAAKVVLVEGDRKP